MTAINLATLDQIKANLSKWDELSPINEQQLKSVLLLTELNNLQPSSSDASDSSTNDGGVSATAGLSSPATTTTPTTTTTTTSSSAAASISTAMGRERHGSSGGGGGINEDINELLYNFDINDIEDPRIDRYVQTLQRNSRKCAQISNSIDTAFEHLGVLLENYEHVSQKTRSLHVACEQLLSDQNKLVNASYALNSRLSYFTDMETFMQKLNSPTIENNCEYIIPMLTRIDECIGYLEENMSHKDSAQYMQIVLQVLRKSLQIIKTYTINSLIGVTNQIIASMQNQNLNQTNQSDEMANGGGAGNVVKFTADNSYTMFYSKFRVNATRIKTLMEQLEQRVELNNQPDYEHALADCHRCYIQQRKLFISQSVQAAIADLVIKYQRDTCSLVRSSCSFMIHLCQDEMKLYKNFFSKNSIFFEKFLEDLCMILYDKLRPIIIHVVHIETLAELCSILKSEILVDNVRATKSDQLSAFDGVCSQMLEDVQERLVYRTHIYIREEILNYNPSPGDLSYPEKLEIMEKIAQEQELRQQQSQMKRSESTSSGEMSMSMSINSETGSLSGDNPNRSSSTRMSPQDQHGMWFPTLRRTLICLSKLYRCLDKKTFEGLSQETLSMCVQSLVKASDGIKKNKTQNDGDLFLIKHLLILREQIAPFNNDFSVVEVQLDFTKIRDAAYGLMNKKNKFFQLNRDNAFMDFLLNGTLEARENLVDSKREVDNQLKKSCEMFIENVSVDLFGTVRELAKKTLVQMQSSETNGPKVVLSQQPFAKPDKLHDLFAENYKDVRKKLPKINNSMSLYLSNKDIEQIIMKRVKNSMQQSYMEISQIVAKNYTEEEQLIIACPTSEQISLWLTLA